MADTTDSPPFVRHHRTARALVSTFREAVTPRLSARGAITSEEFERVFALMMDHWPSVLPLFARTCRSCAGALPVIEGMARPALFKPDGRRRDFVTRLMFSPVMERVAETRDPITGLVFPRVVAPGLQANLNALFYDTEWTALNGEAMAVFNQIGTDRDGEVWERIARHDLLPATVGTLFVRVLMRFKQFHLQRQTFIRRMIETLRERRFVFTDEHFDTLFDGMFVHLREELGTELGRARLDVRYGEDTAGTLLRIFDAFDKRRQERAQPLRSPRGGR